MGQAMTGTIVLEVDSANDAHEAEFDLVFLDAQSMNYTTTHQTGQETELSVVASPDGGLLAFTQRNLDVNPIINNVVILNAAGETYQIINLEDDWTFFTWLDASQILIRPWGGLDRYFVIPYDKNNRGELKGLLSIDVTSGTMLSLLPNFPGLEFPGRFLAWGAITLYDSTLTRVIYPVNNDFVLWDMEQERELLRMSNGSWPTWSPDNKQFAVVIDIEIHPAPPKSSRSIWHEEIFIISRDGKVEQVTDFWQICRVS